MGFDLREIGELISKHSTGFVVGFVVAAGTTWTIRGQLFNEHIEYLNTVIKQQEKNIEARDKDIEARDVVIAEKYASPKHSKSDFPIKELYNQSNIEFERQHRQ